MAGCLFQFRQRYMFRRAIPYLFLFLTVAGSAYGFDFSPEGILASVDTLGTGSVALMLLVALATLVSEDLTCIAAGLLAARGDMTPTDAVIACYVGIVAGDLLIFYAGRALGMAFLNRPPLSWILRPEGVKSAEKLFAKRGTAIIFISRFTPGSRSSTSFAAGALKQHAGRFATLFALAAAIWTPLLVLCTMHVGKSMLTSYQEYARWALPCLIVAAL